MRIAWVRVGVIGPIWMRSISGPERALAEEVKSAKAGEKLAVVMDIDEDDTVELLRDAA